MTEARVEARVVAAGRGWQWLLEGYGLFRKSTVLWLVLTVGIALAEESTPNEQPETITVTGSRIIQRGAQNQQPISTIDRDQIDKSGLGSVGELLQQLTTGGKALNAKFNSSGNLGYPPDGGGIGAGSAQVDLRSLDSKRVLVLVDGVRWVNESSASGVSGSADLNTIPMSIVDHVEVLEDGASAIYGSDAIAGVVNIITKSPEEMKGTTLQMGGGEIGTVSTSAVHAGAGGGARDGVGADDAARGGPRGGDQEIAGVAVVGRGLAGARGEHPAADRAQDQRQGLLHGVFAADGVHPYLVRGQLRGGALGHGG